MKPRGSEVGRDESSCSFSQGGEECFVEEVEQPLRPSTKRQPGQPLQLTSWPETQNGLVSSVCPRPSTGYRFGTTGFHEKPTKNFGTGRPRKKDIITPGRTGKGSFFLRKLNRLHIVSPCLWQVKSFSDPTFLPCEMGSLLPDLCRGVLAESFLSLPANS